MTYTIERLSKPEDFTEDIIKFLKEEAPKLSALFNDVFNCESFRLYMFAQRGAFLICRRDGEIRGTIIAALQETLLDPKVKMLKQILFYVKPKSGRTAYYLFKKFIDIGKTEANHIITMTTSQTNIKSESLKKLGFKELETLYRLEV